MWGCGGVCVVAYLVEDYYDAKRVSVCVCGGGWM